MSVEVSSANNLGDDFKFSGRSLMYIRKISGSNIDPSGTPASIGAHGMLGISNFLLSITKKAMKQFE